MNGPLFSAAQKVLTKLKNACLDKSACELIQGLVNVYSVIQQNKEDVGHGSVLYPITALNDT